MPDEKVAGTRAEDECRGEAQIPAAGDVSAEAFAPETRRKRRLLEALDVSRDSMTTCPDCRGTSLCRWGKNQRSLQRWKCRDCRRFFSVVSNTPFARVHSLDKLHAVGVDMLAGAPRSCRDLAAALALDRMTVWRWRRLIAKIWSLMDATASNDDVEECNTESVAKRGSSRTTLHESRKASREWIDHYREPERYPAPDRLRWIDYRLFDVPLPEPMSRYRVPVELANARTSTDTAPAWTTVGDRQAATGGRAVSVVQLIAGSGPASSVGLAASKPASFKPGGANVSTVDASGSSISHRFQQFLAPFRGPATRHLHTYIAWFEARLDTMNTARPVTT